MVMVMAMMLHGFGGGRLGKSQACGQRHHAHEYEPFLHRISFKGK
jgi:hypothetical protein